MDMFAQASRLQLRFNTSQGSLSVEDLWNLHVSSTNAKAVTLEGLAQNLKRQLKEQEGSDTVFGSATVSRETTKTKKLLQLRFDIVKFIGETLVKEAEKRENRAKAREATQRIMELMQKKQNQELEGKTLEELQQLLAQQTQNVGGDDEDDFA